MSEKSFAELMRESMGEFSHENKEIYVPGFGTWDTNSLKRNINTHINDLATRVGRDDYEGIRSSLDTGVLKAMLDALVESFNDE